MDGLPLGVFKEPQSSDHDHLSEAYALADQYEGTTWLLLSGGDKSAAATPFLSLDNTAVRVRSMHMDQTGKSVLLRLLNVTNETQPVTCSVEATVKGGSLTKLDGTTLSTLSFPARKPGRRQSFPFLKMS